MKIRITLPTGAATGEIEDSPVGRDLITLLPVTLDMYDLFEREKPGPRTSSPAARRASTWSSLLVDRLDARTCTSMP